MIELLSGFELWVVLLVGWVLIVIMPASMIIQTLFAIAIYLNIGNTDSTIAWWIGVSTLVLFIIGLVWQVLVLTIGLASLIVRR